MSERENEREREKWQSLQLVLLANLKPIEIGIVESKWTEKKTERAFF